MAEPVAIAVLPGSELLLYIGGAFAVIGLSVRNRELTVLLGVCVAMLAFACWQLLPGPAAEHAGVHAMMAAAGIVDLFLLAYVLSFVDRQILNLLVRLKATLGLSYLFISHDLSVVRYFSDRIMVMYLGRIVESGTSEAVWSTPLHPYTRLLLESVPRPEHKSRARAAAAGGGAAAPAGPGCRFSPRCPLATDLCRSTAPDLREIAGAHAVACHHADDPKTVAP